jgi:hypothetical protein
MEREFNITDYDHMDSMPFEGSMWEFIGVPPQAAKTDTAKIRPIIINERLM